VGLVNVICDIRVTGTPNDAFNAALDDFCQKVAAACRSTEWGLGDNGRYLKEAVEARCPMRLYLGFLDDGDARPKVTLELL
jgi:hypothetical protein